MTKQNKNKKTIPPAIARAIAKIIHKIEEKSANEDYIYRGEPEHYPKISSSLYRDYPEIDTEDFDIGEVQKEILNEAKKYTDEDKKENQILSELQHYGGKTNLIDFTTDYRIALFFACDGEIFENGRIILKKKKPLQNNNQITIPQNPPHRIIAQKSVFVRPPKGYIDIKLEEIVNIPDNLKEHILTYLRKYHDISTETIYNDLHGFIRNQKTHKSSYTEFYKGNTFLLKTMKASTEKEKQKISNQAIGHYNEAIELRPDNAQTYTNRGYVYSNTGNYDRAFDDFNKAIEINPNIPEAHHNRGHIYFRKGDYDRAFDDYNKAIEINPNDAEAYNNRGNTYFQKGDHDLAFDDYNKAIEINPNIPEAYASRSIAKKALLDYKGAKADLQTAFKLAQKQGNKILAKQIQKSITDLLLLLALISDS